MKKFDEGAEAILFQEKVCSFDALKKLRVEKKYRPEELDVKIRVGRTRIEARLMHKVKNAGVLCPYVFGIGEDYILMDKINGKTLNKLKKVDKKLYKIAGEYLAKMHKLQIVHGDFTPANLMLGKDGKLYAIDFGLGFVSGDFEDFAVDVLTMANSVGEKEREEFFEGYLEYGEKRVIERMEKVQKRARYKLRKKGE
ncbi:MAG: KEOPS complex kinase/ATPase Bud32 [Candidatus Micrarchaeota archaeon]